HSFRSAPFSCAVCLCNDAADGKAVSVLHKRMAHVAELGLAPLCLPIELGFGIGRALMRVVLAHLTMKIRAVIPMLGALRLEAFVRGPSLDQRAVDREMLVRQKRLHLRVCEKRSHELLEHVAFLKAFPILREHCHIPDPPAE